MSNTKLHLSFITLFICVLFYINIPGVLAVSYKDNLNTNGKIIQENSSYNIEKARSLNNYVDGLLNEIFELKREHAISNKKIDQYIFDLKLMGQSLKNIQTTQFEKVTAGLIIDSVIAELSSSKLEIATVLKGELQVSKLKLTDLKRVKSARADIISTRILQFVERFEPKVRRLSDSSKKSDILLSLGRIETAAINLGGFRNRLFSSQLKMNENYSNSIREIKRELLTIKSIIISK